MRRQGAHLRDIASKTGSDMQTVKGWVHDIPLKEKK